MLVLFFIVIIIVLIVKFKNYNIVLPNNSNTHNDKGDTIENSINTQKENIISPNGEIIDDAFIMRVEDTDFTYDNLRKIYFYPKEEIEPIKLDENRTFQLLTFKIDKDFVQFFKGDGTLFPYKIIILSDQITLDKDIQIGINKTLLEKKFNTKISTNKITVQNIEGGVYFTFFFEENILVKITYNVEYID